MNGLEVRVALAAALVLGVGAVASARARREVRFTPRARGIPLPLLPQPLAPLSALYFTSRLCGACAETPQLLHETAPDLPTRALPVDHHASLARTLGVTQTPTLLLVDAEGRILSAWSGNPTRGDLEGRIREALGRPVGAPRVG